MSKFTFKNLFQSEFIRNSSLLLSGNFAGLLISFLAYPVLTRIYSDADFGILASLLSICGILTHIGTGHYEEAIVIAEDKKEVVSILGFSFKLLTVFTLVILLILFFFRNEVLSLFKWEALEPFWGYIPATVFFSGSFYILNNLAIREKKFKMITSSYLTQNLVNTIGKIVMGLLSFTRIGQIFSNLLSYICGNLPYYSLKTYFKEVWKGSWAEEKRISLKYKEFPYYSSSRLLMSGISLNLPFLLLLSHFGDARLGLYSLAFLILYRPIQLIANSLYSTFFEDSASVARDNKPILPKMKKYWIALCKYILPFFVLGAIVARPAFRIVFGSDWEESGLYFQYLLPWMFMMMIVSPVYFIPIILKRQNKALIIEVLWLIFRLISLYIGIHLADFQTGILLFSITGFVFSVLLFFWFYSLIKKYEKRLEFTQ